MIGENIMFEVSIIIPISYTIHLNSQEANSNIDQMIDELIELSGKL